jgi:hypothetical protein
VFQRIDVNDYWEVVHRRIGENRIGENNMIYDI